jgi:hypothetical protein
LLISRTGPTQAINLLSLSSHSCRLVGSGIKGGVWRGMAGWQGMGLRLSSVRVSGESAVRRSVSISATSILFGLTTLFPHENRRRRSLQSRLCTELIAAGMW